LREKSHEACYWVVINFTILISRQTFAFKEIEKRTTVRHHGERLEKAVRWEVFDANEWSWRSAWLQLEPCFNVRRPLLACKAGRFLKFL